VFRKFKLSQTTDKICPTLSGKLPDGKFEERQLPSTDWIKDHEATKGSCAIRIGDELCSFWYPCISLLNE